MREAEPQRFGGISEDRRMIRRCSCSRESHEFVEIVKSRVPAIGCYQGRQDVRERAIQYRSSSLRCVFGLKAQR